MKIKDSIVLVTGANRGIGRAFVDALLNMGAKKIYATARDVTALDELKAAEGERIVPVQLDVTRSEMIDAAA
ncbi:MAG TPA: SDR family NAD(P)-dependent oxidoreductase, partial [Alphaproteobacteria bacterium]|nr:SDR family NAD(P)-dependent oxidoreductase [Alphaproteobacteria bacterium]